MINDIIKYLSVKENYDRCFKFINKDTVPIEVYELLRFLPSQWEQCGSEDSPRITDWGNLYLRYALQCPGSKSLGLIKSLCDSLQASEKEEPKDEIIQYFIDRSTAEELSDYCIKIAEGNGGDFVGVQKILEKYKATSKKLARELQDGKQGQVDILSRLLSIKSGGYKWHMECLNELFGPLSTELIIVASRPDGGKTTFLANEAWYIAKQLPPEKCVLWFNNEEHINKVARRVVQSCLGQPESYISSNLIQASRLYERELGGKDHIVFIDDATDMGTIERALDIYNPGLIIIDQLYKVKSCSSASSKSETDAEGFRQKCAYARELAKHIAPVIATNQLDATAENNPYPGMDALYGSKTGAQGEADGILMIGRTNSYPDKRFIYTPKNKMTGKNSEKFEVIIHKDIARYESL